MRSELENALLNLQIATQNAQDQCEEALKLINQLKGDCCAKDYAEKFDNLIASLFEKSPVRNDNR